MAEFNPSDLIETGSNAIPNGQVASIMRRSMENRNLLSEKGALYAGTGEPYVTQDSVGNTYNTAITDAVEAPTQSGQVLVSNLDSGGPDTGLEWQDAAPNAINATNATNATKLTSGTVGSSTAPVYFNNGQPAACGNSLAVNITGNAATATNATNLTPFGGIVNPNGRGNSTSAGANSTAIGYNTTASKQNDTAYGFNSSATGGGSAAFGSNSAATGAGSVALGDGAESSGDNSISIGEATSSGAISLALGYNSVASGDRTLAIGAGAQATQQDCVALGDGAKATGLLTLAMGYGAKAEGDGSVTLRGTATGEGSVALGAFSQSTGDSSVAVGSTASASGNGGTCVGEGSSAKGDFSVAIGIGASADGNQSVALGTNASTSSADAWAIQLGDSHTSTLRCQVQLTVQSDKRDKTDIASITDSLEFINKLNPVTYVDNGRIKYISDEDKKDKDFRTYGMCKYDREAHARGTKKGSRRRCGLIAQEVLGAIQEVYNSDNYANIVNDNFYDLVEKPENVENQYTLAYSNLIPFLIGAIKEQQVQIEELKKEVVSLKNKN